MSYWAVISLSPFKIEHRKVAADNLDDVLYVLRSNYDPVIIVVETTSKEIVWKSNLYDNEQHQTAFQSFLKNFSNK